MTVTKRNARVIGNLEVYGTLQDNGSCIYDTMGAYILTATGKHLQYSTSKPCAL